MTEKIGKCHDCTAPQTEVNMLSRHILELQSDKGRLTDKVRELERKIASIRGCHRVDLAKLRARTEQVERLKKENVELERKLEQTEKDLADYQFNYPTIKELEAEVKEWKDKADLWCKTANLKDHNIMINKELEKENAELEHQLTHRNCLDCSNHSSKLRMRTLELEKENAELKETCNKWFEHLKNREEELLNELNNQNAKYNEQIEELKEENAELKEELKKWKDEWQEQVQKATDEGYARTLQTVQLTKAKFLLKQLVYAFPKSYSDVVKDTLDEARKFVEE